MFSISSAGEVYQLSRIRSTAITLKKEFIITVFWMQKQASGQRKNTREKTQTPLKMMLWGENRALAHTSRSGTRRCQALRQTVPSKSSFYFPLTAKWLRFSFFSGSWDRNSFSTVKHVGEEIEMIQFRVSEILSSRGIILHDAGTRWREICGRQERIRVFSPPLRPTIVTKRENQWFPKTLHHK